MEYEFSNAPIISRRIDRRSAKQKQRAAEKAEDRFREFSELFSVEQLLEMGFYNKSIKQLPYGIEVWNRLCHIRDESTNYEWEEQLIPTLALCLPRMERLNKVQSMNPMYWEESQTFYWRFKQQGNVVLYCILDLLNRLIDLPHWESVDAIPLRWSVGNSRALEFAKYQISRINDRSFDLRWTIPSIPEGVSINAARHLLTPYDYEWETGKVSRDTSREYWNQVLSRQRES